MAEEPVIAKGSNGTIFAYKNKAVISRKGFMGHFSQGIKGNRTIFYKDIKSVEFNYFPICLCNLNGYRRSL